MTALDRMMDAVRGEIDRAQSTYGDYTSTHEALGVLSEEWDELREAVQGDDVEAQCQVAHEDADVADWPADWPQSPTAATFTRRSFKWARK
jgi:hypothetical protein